MNNTSSEKTQESWWPKIDVIIVFALAFSVAFSVGKVMGQMFWQLVLILGGPYWIGSWFFKWYLAKRKITRQVFKIIMWLNVIVWLLPPLGMFLAGSSFNLKKYSTDHKSNVNTALCIIGLVFSLGNAALGVYFRVAPLI